MLIRRTIGFLAALLIITTSVYAQDQDAADARVIDLTVNSAVEIALSNSYRVEQLELGVQRTRSWLEAERAGLKSRAYVNVTSPQVESISDQKWNSNLQRYEIVRENSRMWRVNTAIRQPVVLFGYPTNGHLSLNNTLYRYTQIDDGRDVRYYNRYFIKYEQPLFQPNTLKNNLEEAELDLEDEELEFKRDIVDIIDDAADDFYDLFEERYRREIYSNLVANLQEAERIAQQFAEEDTSRSLEVDQVQVELANAQERLNQTNSNFRLEASRVKQDLRLSENDSLRIDPAPNIQEINVDLDRAIQYGNTLRPRTRRLEIQRRQRELDVENAEGWNSFRVNLEATYGREMQHPRIQQLWEQPTNSYSVGLNVHIPVWDWGRHNSRVQARKISLQQTNLRIERTREQIRSDIQNALRNLEEYQQRALDMQENLVRAEQIATTSLRRYANDEISVTDLVQSLNRQRETAENFLDAYLGYRSALLTLKRETYYDFERQMPLLDRFEVDVLAQVQD
jgi:outer membrane protein TolC